MARACGRRDRGLGEARSEGLCWTAMPDMGRAAKGGGWQTRTRVPRRCRGATASELSPREVDQRWTSHQWH